MYVVSTHIKWHFKFHNIIMNYTTWTTKKKLTKEKGIDHYIGFLLKDVDLKYEEKVKNEELRKLEPVSEGDPEKVFTNPGSVTYADVKAYLEKKQKERYKNNFS